ncbi:hypothetical protein PRIPAC_82033 [Pristionchus pacificus]|nr:hypothetical protein PRIPAC_82033 [Pristionchus pacificus]
MTNRIYGFTWLYDERSEEAIVACVCENAIISIVNECTGKEVMLHSGVGNAVNEIRVNPAQFTIYARYDNSYSFEAITSCCTCHI